MNYIADAYVVPLGSCDIILGVSWLVTLGSTIWNFEKLTMEFVCKGRRHLLEGQKNEELKWDMMLEGTDYLARQSTCLQYTFPLCL